MSQVTFNNKKSPFFRELKGKVDNYFAETGLQQTGNAKLFIKGLLLILSSITIYIILVFFTPGILIAILLCTLLGLNMAAVGFNIVHEAGHQSFSKSKQINKLSAYLLNIMGGESNFWKVKHNINHHTFTNIEGLDSDIKVEPFMRLNENQAKFWFHRFQHIYWVLLYGLSYKIWIFYQDFEKYFSKKITAGSDAKKLSYSEHIIFWISKIFYISAFIVLPIIMVGATKAIAGFLIMTFVTGLFISVVFQLAHIVEDTQFIKPDPENKNKIDHEWAIHQVLTTANFATKNKFLSWLLGGLNFQVEHHLFPKVSHIHYPKINQFVKETCEQFNITYLEYPTAFKAFRSHLQHIKKMGKA